MLFRVFIAAVLGSVCFAALAQMPSPAIVGVRSEPTTLLYYGGTGLLAGLFTVGAIVCGIVLGLRRIQHRATRPPGRVAILAYRLIWVVVRSRTSHPPHGHGAPSRRDQMRLQPSRVCWHFANLPGSQ